METGPDAQRIEHDLPCPYCRYNLRSLQPGGTCPECGHGIPSAPRTLSGFIPCPHCGKENLALSPLCVYCRTALPAYVLPPRQSGTPAARASRPYSAPLVNVCAAALLLVLSLRAGGGITLYRALLAGYLLASLAFLCQRWRRQHRSRPQ